MSSELEWLESLLPLLDQPVLTAGEVTPGRAAVTAKPERRVTTKSVTGKRAYKPRARRCRGCHELFTPKRNGDAKCCSDACRQRVKRSHDRKLGKVESAPADRPLVLCSCLWCPNTWLADGGKHPKYCSGTCRTAAYRWRRFAAIEPLSRLRICSVDQAARAVKRDGMRKVVRELRRAGLTYDDAAHGWVPALRIVKTTEGYDLPTTGS